MLINICMSYRLFQFCMDLFVFQTHTNLFEMCFLWFIFIFIYLLYLLNPPTQILRHWLVDRKVKQAKNSTEVK